MKTSRRPALLALGLVVVASVSGASPATADTQIVEVGWWRSVAGSEPPEGGVAVGGNATGPTAVAAVRVSVSGDAPLTADLTLLEADSIVGDTAGLVVCPTTDQWTAAAGGSMDEAPAPDCDRSTPLNRGESGEWTAEVSSLLMGGTVSLMIVPGPAGESADPLAGAAPFEVSFQAPTLTAAAPPSEPSAGSEQPSSTGPSPSADPRPPFDPIPIDRGDTAFAPPPMTGTQTGAPAAPPAADQVAVAPVSPVPTRSTADADGGGGRNWGQAVSYVLLAAAIGAAAGVAHWQLRSRGLLPG